MITEERTFDCVYRDPMNNVYLRIQGVDDVLVYRYARPRILSASTLLSLK